MAVDDPELQKPLGVPCHHLCATGCGIHGHHPKVCQTYRCSWLEGWLPQDMRPDDSGIILDTVYDIDGLHFLIGKEIKPGAFNKLKRRIKGNIAIYLCTGEFEFCGSPEAIRKMETFILFGEYIQR